MKTQNQKDSASFKNLVELMAIFTDATNRLEALENEANSKFLEFLDEIKIDYADLQEALKKAELAAEAVVVRHPEWFKIKKSIKTPYGTVGFRESKSLDVPNEEASIILIENEIEKTTAEIIALHEKLAASDAESAPKLHDAITNKTDHALVLKSCLRQKTELDKEALEKLDDTTLEKFRIKRTSSNNFQIKAAKIDIGKAVKEAVEAAA